VWLVMELLRHVCHMRSSKYYRCERRGFPHHRISKHHLNALDVVVNAWMKGVAWPGSITGIAKLGLDFPLSG